MSEMIDAITDEVSEVHKLVVGKRATMKDGTVGKIVGIRVHGTYWDAASKTTIPAGFFVGLDIEGEQVVRPWAEVVALNG